MYQLVRNPVLLHDRFLFDIQKVEVERGQKLFFVTSSLLGNFITKLRASPLILGNPKNGGKCPFVRGNGDGFYLRILCR